jgi:hypothetical protein
MAKDRSLVRASDIGLWSFCQRAWWLAHVKDVPHRHPSILQRGQNAHAAHGRAVMRAQRLRLLGLGLVALAVLLAALMMLLWLTQP